METAKYNIRKIVKEYEKLFAFEFEAFKDGMKAVRASLADAKYAKVDGYNGQGAHATERALYELPETLHGMFVSNLSEEQLTWLKSGTKENPNEGGRWFAEAFPAYRIPEKI